MEKKRQLKLKFDTNYDGDETGGKAHYEELKKEVDTQATVRRKNILQQESEIRLFNMYLAYSLRD